MTDSQLKLRITRIRSFGLHVSLQPTPLGVFKKLMNDNKDLPNWR